MSTVPSVDQDQESVGRALHAVPRPELVKEPLVEYREDHTGDDAVYITFPVSRKIPSSPKRARVLSAFVRQLEEHLYEAKLKRIPYIRFSETR